MKHLIKNNQIVQSGITGYFKREDGEEFWGGYETRTDLHDEDGWREEVLPDYNPKTQRLGELYFDAARNVVTYQVIDLELNIDELYQQKLDQFEAFQKDIRQFISGLFLEEIVLGNVPQALTDILAQMKLRKEEIYATLLNMKETGNIDSLLSFHFDTEEAQQIRDAITALKAQ